MTTVRDLGEHALIARITSRLTAPRWVVVGPGDDAAVIEPQPRALDVLTTDALVEGVHFDRRFCPLDAIGHKALAVNLSDLAAMGAEPRAALLSLILPHSLNVADVDAILDGMLALAARHRVAIVGGNITKSAAPGAAGPGPLVIDVAAIGAVGRRRILTRGAVGAGDELYVTGSIGAGAAGLQALWAGGEAATAEGLLHNRYLRPEPRTRAGMLLGRNRAATACIDLSDGLADGIRQLAAASGVGFTVDASALPIDPAARAWYERHGTDPVMSAVAGGDDYELLFTVRVSQRGRLRGVRQQIGGLALTRIGVATRDTTLVLRTPAGNRELPAGFEHFR